jgi:hypothetical protein
MNNPPVRRSTGPLADEFDKKAKQLLTPLPSIAPTCS